MTLLFSDLCDYTALTEASDPEDIVWLKQEIATAAKQVIGDRGGSINQFYGDGILAVFGYPVPEEDDARHGIEAALAASRVHPRAARGLRPSRGVPASRMHSGVHSGVVFVREERSAARLGTRLAPATRSTRPSDSARRPGPTRSSSAARRSRDRAVLRDGRRLLPLSLKGKERPMLASRVLGRSDVEPRASRCTEPPRAHAIRRAGGDTRAAAAGDERGGRARGPRDLHHGIGGHRQEPAAR